MRTRCTLLSIMGCLFLITLAQTARAQTLVPRSQLKGAVVVEPNTDPGYSLWVDAQGFHLRWTTNTPLLFSGRLDLDRRIGELTRVSKTGPGWVKAHGDRIVLFSSTSRGGVDGFDLIVPGGQLLYLDLQIDSKPAAPEQVRLGEKAEHPKGLPLKLYLR